MSVLVGTPEQLRELLERNGLVVVPVDEPDGATMAAKFAAFAEELNEGLRIAAPEFFGEITAEDVAAEPLLQFFGWSHLPEHLQERSALFGRLALAVVRTTPRNPERTVALRKLLEAKDAGVRAHLPPPQPLNPPSGPPETVGVPVDSLDLRGSTIQGAP